MAYLKKYWIKYRWMFLLSVACVSGEAVCDLTQPRIMSRLIDEGAVKGDLAYVLRTSLVMLGVAGLGALFAFTRNLSASYASQGFGAELRLDLFAKIQSLELEDMDRFDGGSLVTRMTNDITQVQNFVNGMMRIFFKAPIMCAGAIVMASSLNLRVLPIIAPIVIIVAFIISASMRMSYPRFAKVQEAIDKLNTTMREYLNGIRLVKAFRRFGEEEKRFSESNDLLTENTVKANNVLSIFTPCMSLTVNFGIAAVIFFGAKWIDTGDMQVGQIMAFVTYMTQLLGSLNMISNVLNMFVRVKSSNRRVNEVMSIQSAKNTVSGMTKKDADAHIVFEDVGFEYKGSTGQAALSGLNFSVQRGETLGIIGPTGSGKSTAAALLMRFYDASGGEIRISGVPVTATPESLLREKIAIVPQTATLFSGTVLENILWGKGKATDEEVEEAAVEAEAHGFVSAMPDGYNTVIGQSGVNLSGGQKQRLSIARALIRKPEILVLDDCTSALDAVTESKVKKAIRALPNSITCVLITQRINTAMSCDKILVLDSGKQAGIGSHGELMETCSVYRDIYLSQIGKGANVNGSSDRTKA